MKIWAVGIIAMLVASGIGLAVAVGKQKVDLGAIDLENAMIHEIGGFVAVKPENEVTTPDNATAVAVIYKINPDGTKELTKIINLTDLKMKGYVGYMVKEYANGTTIEKALTKEDLNELRKCRHYCNMTDNVQYIHHRAYAWNYITGESRCIATAGHPLYGCGAESCDGWTNVYTFWC